MFRKLGIYSLLVGFFSALFSFISKFMNAKNIWVDMTIAKLVGEDTSKIVESIGNESLQGAAQYFIFKFHFYGVFIALGVLFFIASFFMKEH
jgi:hypothetical protein